MKLFPVFLRLEGRRVLLVGGGPIAASKLPGLLSAGAEVVVVSPDVHPEIVESGVEIRQRGFSAGDLDGVFFVVAAAPPEVNAQVLVEAEKRGLFVNAVDDLRSATAYLGGVVRKGGVTLAVSTDGKAPALAGLIREALELVLPADGDGWLPLAEKLRAAWKQSPVPMSERRPMLLRALIEKYKEFK